MTSSSLLVCLTSLMAGCGFLQPRGELTLDEKAAIISQAARAATFLAINRTYDSKDEKIVAAGNLRANVNSVVLRSDQPFDSAAESLLLSRIPSKYSPYLQSAFVLLKAYYKTPSPGDLLGADNSRLLQAMFGGISNGCDDVLRSYGVEVK